MTKSINYMLNIFISITPCVKLETDPQWAKIFNSTKKTTGKRPHPLSLKENEGTKKHHSEPTDAVSGTGNLYRPQCYHMYNCVTI